MPIFIYLVIILLWYDDWNESMRVVVNYWARGLIINRFDELLGDAAGSGYKDIWRFFLRILFDCLVFIIFRLL